MAQFMPLLGAAASILYDKFGKGDKMGQVPTMTKGQQGLLNQMLQMLGQNGGLGQGFNKAIDYQQQLMNPNSTAVDQFVQPYMQQFEQQTVPGLAERFAGMGAQGGGLSSSGFGQSLSAASGNLQSQLAALKAGLGQQAASSLMNQYGSMAQGALGASPFGYTSPQQGAFPSFLNAWGKSGFAGANDMFSGLGDLYQKYMPIIGNV